MICELPDRPIFPAVFLCVGKNYEKTVDFVVVFIRWRFVCDRNFWWNNRAMR
jgi:hypothetical protein